MNLALKSAWLVLTAAAVLSLFMPGDTGIVAAVVLIVLYFPLGPLTNVALAASLNLLRPLGWTPDGDTQWLALNVALMLLLSGAGYLQWFVLFPRVLRGLRRK